MFEVFIGLVTCLNSRSSEIAGFRFKFICCHVYACDLWKFGVFSSRHRKVRIIFGIIYLGVECVTLDGREVIVFVRKR